jgi:hypothetical protein
VHGVTVEPVVSTATASQFKFRSSEGANPRGYLLPSTGTRVLAKFQQTRTRGYYSSYEFSPRPPVYNGARILRELGMSFPHIMTSEEAVRRTLRSEESRRAICIAGALPPSSSTHSRTAGERDSYSPGQAVFITDSNPDSDVNWPALVVKVAGNRFFVKLVGDLNEAPPFKIPKS